MIRDYFIMAYLTLISCWPITLPAIVVATWWLFRIRWRFAGIVAVLLFVLVAIAAWQFEHYF